MNGVYNFLSLAPQNKEFFDNVRDAINVRPEKLKRIGDMKDATRKMLQDFFKQDNQRLLELMNYDENFDFNSAT